MTNHHFLLVSLAAQGHINPSLQLAKNLARTGARVTFATSVKCLRRVNNLPILTGLSFTFFSDGDDDAEGPKGDFNAYMDKMKRVGYQSLTNLIRTLSDGGHPVTFLIYTVLLPWAAEVAREMHVPSAFLAIQCGTVFVIYHRLFNSHNGLYNGDNNANPPSISIKLPGLPMLTCDDIPSFLLPRSPFFSSLFPIFQEHIQTLEKNPNPCILINTFDALEEESIKAIDGVNVFAIGPLVPSAFCDGNDLSDTSFGCDLFQSSRDYLKWLDSKPEKSVIYVSFGSLAVIQKSQKEELLQGLVESGLPFLWVIRDLQGEEENAMIENGMSEEGLIVPWCSQVEVLCHRSVGCFVTHCGWNSTLESLVAGVPVVALPQFSDQLTNAKLMEEAWGTGVKAKGNDEGVVERDEIGRCLHSVMGGGDKGEEIKRNAVKWKGLAVEAAKEGGSSHNNLKQFLESLG